MGGNMSRSVQFGPGEFYHLYNRGTDKRVIFVNPRDYERFLALLYLCNQSEPVIFRLQGNTFKELLSERKAEPLVDIVSYCLMPNHVHVLVHERKDNGISKFMQKVMTGYTMYFNKKYERTGALFQGTFKATHVNNDRYLSYLISYIHLNPIKLIDPLWKEAGIANTKRAKNYLQKYPYSTYLDYLGNKRIERVIINKEAMPDFFYSGLDFERHVTEWLSYIPD